MSAVRPWFKMYPSDFIAGCMKLTVEEKGAYATVLFMIYDKDGPLENDHKWIARVCGCSTRRMGQLLQTLIAKGKLSIEDNGMIHSPGAKKRIENDAKVARKFAENGAKGGDKKAENRRELLNNSDLSPKGLPDFELKKPSILESRVLEEERKEESVHTPESVPAGPVAPKRARAALVCVSPENGFDDFWAAYPRKDDKGHARQAYARALRKTSEATILDGVKRYGFNPVRRFQPLPTTWLNGERWLCEEDDFDPDLAAAGISREMLEEHETHRPAQPPLMMAISGGRPR